MGAGHKRYGNEVFAASEPKHRQPVSQDGSKRLPFRCVLTLSSHETAMYESLQTLHLRLCMQGSTAALNHCHFCSKPDVAKNSEVEKDDEGNLGACDVFVSPDGEVTQVHHSHNPLVLYHATMARLDGLYTQMRLVV